MEGNMVKKIVLSASLGLSILSSSFAGQSRSMHWVDFRGCIGSVWNKVCSYGKKGMINCSKYVDGGTFLPIFGISVMGFACYKLLVYYKEYQAAKVELIKAGYIPGNMQKDIYDKYQRYIKVLLGTPEISNIRKQLLDDEINIQIILEHSKGCENPKILIQACKKLDGKRKIGDSFIEVYCPNKEWFDAKLHPNYIKEVIQYYKSTSGSIPPSEWTLERLQAVNAINNDLYNQ